MLTRILLFCGIMSSLLYIGTDIIAAQLYSGYSYIDQAISEIGAIGAPTRPLWIFMSNLYNPLVIAFGIGVLRLAGHRRSLRITAIILIIYGIISFMGPYFPMHMRESGAGMTFTDIMHIILTAGLVLSIMLFIGFGAAAFNKWFRLYSILTLLVILIFGALAGLQGASLAGGLPTPWLGIIERVNVYSSLLWILMFAVVLLRNSHSYPY